MEKSAIRLRCIGLSDVVMLKRDVFKTRRLLESFPIRQIAGCAADGDEPLF